MNPIRTLYPRLVPTLPPLLTLPFVLPFAAAMFGAFTDLDSLIASNPALDDKVCAAIWPGLAARRDEIVARRSAWRWAERLRSPVLLMRGGAGGQASPSPTLLLAERLQRLGREYGLRVYAGDGHGLRRNRVDRAARAADWFRRHDRAVAE